MAKLTETKNRPVMGVYHLMVELRKTNNIGAIALADMFIEAYENKYGRVQNDPTHSSAREQLVLKKLESSRGHIQDQDLLDIVDQLIKLLHKTVKV